MIFYSEEQIWSGIISDKWHQVHLYTFCRAVGGRCIGSSNPGLPPVITMPVSPSPSVYSNHQNPSRFHYSPEPYLVVFSNFDIYNDIKASRVLTSQVSNKIIHLHCKLATHEVTGELHYKRSSYFYIVNWPLMGSLGSFITRGAHTFTL